jgi:hypothetical protein
MTTLHAQIPDSLMKQVNELARQEQTTVDQLVAIALAAQVSAWKATESIAARAQRADYLAFDRVMAKVPNVPPLAGDELPEGYEPISSKPNPK